MTNRTLFFDFEVESSVDLKKHGADRFIKAGAPTWIAWADDDTAPPQAEKWNAGAEVALGEAVSWSDVVVAHNAVFDLLVLKYHAPNIYAMLHKTKTLTCTSAMANVLNYPAGLDALAKRLGLEGKCDLKMGQSNDLFGQYEDAQWRDYVRQDAQVLRNVYRQLRPFVSRRERNLIDLHLRIQLHGVAVDTDRAEKIIQMHRANEAKIDKRFAAITGYQPRQAVKLGGWFQERTGLRTASTKKLNAGFQESWGDDAKQALKLLNHRAKSEANKLEKLLDMQVDGRLRDHLAHASTTTNRWAGRGAHLHNFAKEGQGRSCIIAPHGRKLIVADLSQIELRVGLWLSGMDSALDAINSGQDWYAQLAEQAYGADHPPEVKKRNRHRVKQGVIGAMYSAGVGALQRAVRCTDDEAEFLHRRVQDMLAPMVKIQYELFNAWRRVAEGGQSEKVILPHWRGKVQFGRATAMPGAVLMRTPANSVIAYQQVRMDGDTWAYDTGNPKPTYMKHRGTMFENLASTIAREVLGIGMLAVAENWSIVATIHDEVIVEVDEAEADFAIGDVLHDLRTGCNAVDSDKHGLFVDAEGKVAANWAAA